MLVALDEIRVAIEAIPTTGSGASSETWRDGQCLDCTHWDVITPGVVGYCRRFPPSIESELADGSQKVEWAQTQHGDSCSEYVTHVT